MDNNTYLCVVIPAFKELDVISTLDALYQCRQPQQSVEVILVVNHPIDASEEIKLISYQTVAQINEFLKDHQKSWINCHIIEAFDLPRKKAGVGLARKIGMDEAAYRFNQVNTDGIIVCFDADSLCEDNYLCVLEKSFLNQPAHYGASIHYEHPIYDKEGLLDWPIIYYELHLRYYIKALAFAGYPYSFHTIGSSMAVRSSIYQKSGGMNTRKAGEDFYFLHKIIPLGGFISITDTTITPSSRESDRVPFGTGKAINSHNRGIKLLGYTYDFKIFKLLKSFFNLINTEFNIEQIPSEILAFLTDENLLEELKNIQINATHYVHFTDRFYQWFNGFKVLKCVHYLRDNFYPEVKIEDAVSHLFIQENRIKTEKPSSSDGLEQLLFLRNFEKELYDTV